MSDFQDLLNDAEQLTARIDQDATGLPRLERTLTQLYETGRRKLAKNITTDTSEINASILLASKGIDAPKLTQTIENLQAPSLQQQQQQQQYQPDQISFALQPLALKTLNIENIKDIDIQQFLKLEKEISLMSIVEETRKNLNKKIEDDYWQNSENEWEKQKQKILNALHSTSGDIFNIMQDGTTPASNIGQYSTSKSQSYNYTQGRSLMNDVEMAFAKTIYLYNDKILSSQQEYSPHQHQQQQQQQQQLKPNLLENFFKLSQKLNDKNIEEIWNMLNYMCTIAPLPQSTNEADTARNSTQMQVQFANNAIRYLEYTFKTHLKNYTMANLEHARIGGIPSTLKLINGYLKINPAKYYTSYEEIYVDNQPLWAIIYLCLRCGDYEAARDVARHAKKEDIAGYLDELIENLKNPNFNYRHVSTNSENELKLQYKGKVKRSQDVYKRAVYRYLSHYLIDDDLSDVLDNVDEFLWFYLSTITYQREQQQQHATSIEIQTYQEFQIKMSQEYGEKYFNKNQQNPYSYLQVLILTSQFELAIEYLLKYEQMIVHAVHMAIALYEKNLLVLTRTPSNAQIISKESHDAKNLFRINFASLIKIYTRKFECTDPRDALEYYYFLRNIYNTSSVQQLGMQQQQHGDDDDLGQLKDENNYFAIYIAELALETREFELLFGKLEKNGQRKRGAIDKFLTNTDKIITIVAMEIELKGLFEEAIKLYDLCKQQKRVLELCNKLISPIVSELSIQNSNRDRLKQMTLSIAERYKIETSDVQAPIPKSISTTFNLLCDLMTFFDIYHSEKYESAYDVLNRLDVLPVNSDNIESKVKKFTAFSEEVSSFLFKLKNIEKKSKK
jgi:nuclear pore complex protein Nup93